MLFRLLLLLAAVAPYTLADVEFTTPAAGATVTGGSTLDIEWKESGTGPPITSFSTYQLFLCAGGNDANTFVSTQNACTQIRLGIVCATADDSIADPVDSYFHQWAIQCWEFGSRNYTS